MDDKPLTGQQRSWARMAHWTEDEMRNVLDVRTQLGINVAGIDSEGTTEQFIAAMQGNGEHLPVSAPAQEPPVEQEEQA